MGIFNRFGGEFVDIIEWTQNDSDTMVYRFPRYKNEIKYGAKLTVREGQVAVMVNEGKLADVFNPGIYELETANLPILSTLQSWQHGFESPFKVEIYFFNTTDFLNLKWGTKQAITVKDSEFGIVRLRAFGSYTMRIKDAAIFLRKLVGTDGNFEINEVSEQLTNAIATRFPEVLAESNVSILDLATQYSELAATLRTNIANEFIQYGLEVGQVYIENISLPENVQKSLDEKTGMNIIGDDMQKYTQYQAAKGIGQGGEAGSAMSSGIGMAMGMEMAKQMTDEASSPTSSAIDSADVDIPPPVPKIYYLMIMGERKGPLALEEVYYSLEYNESDSDTLIWRKGLAEWQTIANTPEIDLTRIPPPLPIV